MILATLVLEDYKDSFENESCVHIFNLTAGKTCYKECNGQALYQEVTKRKLSSITILLNLIHYLAWVFCLDYVS